ncbi:TPA: hypothetical protein ACH3X2_000611 [Trebouxia sp. C0005]|nr:MAG: hypothetical protein FRX49_12679 [Trebouxia sp. A1-2]
MNDFDLNIQEARVQAGKESIPLLVVGTQRDLWFRGNNLTAYLGYAQPRVALTKILKGRNSRTFAELSAEVVSSMETTPVDDPRARYVNEPGLYRLIARSTQEQAEAFQDWVYEIVLPSIRKTGSYSLQQQQPSATTAEDNSWCNKRLEGKELMKLKNTSLQQLIAGGFGQAGSKLYAIAGNLINQAVLGFQETTRQFKKQQQLPGHVSIPDMLNMQGQVARCYAETCFQKFVTDNLERLRGLPESELLTEFRDLKINLRQGFVSTGMGDLQQKLLTVDEAKKRKAEQVCQARKRQKLLQMEQPKTVLCAA